MSVLQSLTLIKATPFQPKTPIDSKRQRLVERIEEQIELAKNPAYAPLVPRKYKRNDGTIATIEKPKRIKRWWTIAKDGKVELVIKYGNKQMEFAKGKDAISLQHTSEIEPILEAIKHAVLDGEFDELILKQSAFGKRLTR